MESEARYEGSVEKLWVNENQAPISAFHPVEPNSLSFGSVRGNQIEVPVLQYICPFEKYGDQQLLVVLIIVCLWAGPHLEDLLPYRSQGENLTVLAR